jgi:ferredoxin
MGRPSSPLYLERDPPGRHEEQVMKIYYFSGTGNSLFIAKEIKKAIPYAELVPICLSTGCDAVFPESERVGFVFPIHGFGLPAIVASFIRKLDLASVKYLFAVATKGGSPTIALREIESSLRKKGKRLDSFSYVNMPNNSYFIHDLGTPEETREKLENAEAEAARIAREIRDGSTRTDKDAELNFAKGLALRLLHSLLKGTRYFGFGSAFFADAACSGCGICGSVCPSGRIALIDKRPFWQKRIPCRICLACVSYCPAKAAHNRRLRASRACPDGRYHHPDVASDDISRQRFSGP